MEKRKNCPICYANFIDFKGLACGQICCYDCLVDWIQEKLRYQKDIWIPCMNMYCNVKILFPDLYLRLPEQYKSRLEPLYLSLTSPSSDNTKPKESTCLCTKGKAKDCENTNCKFNHEKITMHPFYSRLKKLLSRESIKQKNESLSEKWKQQFTKPCPNCNVPIEKEGGCFHMTCTGCNYTYNWRYVSDGLYGSYGAPSRNHCDLDDTIIILLFFTSAISLLFCAFVVYFP